MTVVTDIKLDTEEAFEVLDALVTADAFFKHHDFLTAHLQLALQEPSPLGRKITRARMLIEDLLAKEATGVS